MAIIKLMIALTWPSPGKDKDGFDQLNSFISKCSTYLLELGDADEAISQIDKLRAAAEDISRQLLYEHDNIILLDQIF